MALALYRRYRPDTFAGVIGQRQVTEPLMRALDEQRLTHAYLFSGPRGCGKTSSARILARCVNCEKGPTSTPCGECASCVDLATGGPGSIDVVEIDAASHNGVDDARELRERAGFAPARDRYKIFILDEAHMVTQQGFNALLKIVEEPPEHVMFIFATTEPDKVIGTIRSRTHHYPFRLVPQEIMGPYLEDICVQEHIDAEPGVLKLAMRAGGGSVRDTLSVLDQLMVGAVDDTISYDSAVALLGFTPDVLIGEAIDAIINHDGAAFYGIVQKVIVGGFDTRRFIEDLLARTRDLLVLSLGGVEAEKILGDDSSAEDIAAMKNQAHSLGLHELTAMAEIMDDALAHLAGAISPRMRLELLAAKLLAGRETGFASAAPAQTAASQPAGNPQAPRGGFQRELAASTPATPTAQPTHTPAQSQTQSSSSLSSSSAWPSVPAQSTASQEHTAPAQQHTAAPAAAQVDNPDAQWDALVNALPQDVSQYVNRTKVPRVHFTRDSRTGRGKLWIKFDTPMSKYAFALAQSTQEVHGKTRVVDILRAAVHEHFGLDVVLAPTDKMADGQVAPPFNSLPEDQQKNIKEQLLRESLQAGVAKFASRESQESSHADKQSASQEDESAVHRAKIIDPWALPESEPMHIEHIDFDKVHSIEQQAAQHQNNAQQTDYWQHTEPVQAVQSQSQQPQSTPVPQVDPEDDEYSMSDESIANAGVMSLDDVKELFEVKKVEEFAADDPHNPRNTQHKTRDNS